MVCLHEMGSTFFILTIHVAGSLCLLRLLAWAIWLNTTHKYLPVLLRNVGEEKC